MHSKDSKERINRIIESYYGGDIPPEIDDLIQGWMMSDDNPDKEEMLADLFFRNVKVAQEPDENTVRSFKEIQERLNFPHKLVGEPQKKEEIDARRRLIWKRTIFRVAAVFIPVIIAFGVLNILLIRKDNGAHQVIAEITAKTVTVSSGEENRKIILPDGSEITINKGSVLTYNEDFSANRKLRLDGEASFKVAKDSLHPFTVESSDITVTVLGTVFCMKTGKNESTAEVTLSSGSVSVKAVAVNQTKIMKPGQRYVYDRAHRTIELHEIGEEELMRLRGMNMDFDGTLDELFRSIARNSGKVFKVESGIDVKRGLVMPYEGTEPVEDILKMVRTMTSGLFDYSIAKDTIIITKPK